MPSYRVARAQEDVKRELSDIMRGLKDPRVTGLLSIVKLELSGDYSSCRVFISSLEGFDAAKSAVAGLQNAAGFIQRELNKRLRLRRTPEMRFIADGGIEYGVAMNERIRALDGVQEPDEQEKQ
jgi:ribosome-binding factor A